MTIDQKAYFDKYEKLASALGINLLDSIVRNEFKIKELRKAYSYDKHFNTLLINRWDNLAYGLVGQKNPATGTGMSLSDGICVLKHVAQHHTLGK